MGVVTQRFKLLKADFPRLGVHMKVDYRAGPGGRIKTKTDRIPKRLGRQMTVQRGPPK